MRNALPIWPAAPPKAIALRARATDFTVRPYWPSQATILSMSARLTPKRSRSERASDWAGGAAEGNRIAGASYGLHGKTILAEPGNHLVYVGPTYSEAVRVLLRSQPAMVIRRRGILLLRQ